MTRRVSWWRLALLAALIATAGVAVQAAFAPAPAPPPPVPVTSLPEQPAQASAVVIVVSQGSTASGHPDSILGVSGTLAGQRLRFERDRQGRFLALGAIPVNAPETVLVPLAVARASGDTTYQVAHLMVLPGDFPTERIRLARRFVTPPPSLAPQLAEERRALRAAFARTVSTPRLWHEPFARPVPGRVTDPFGTRRQVNGAVQSRHMGADLSGRSGTPVAAANRGVVVAADPFYFQGNAVYLDHGAGLVTSYFHLSRILVAVGDTVAAGQVIGLVGATGRVTGPHLHWQAQFGRVQLDALTLLAPELQALAP